MAKFEGRVDKWVDAPRSSHGMFGTLAPRGLLETDTSNPANNMELHEFQSPKAGQKGVAFTVPTRPWVPMSGDYPPNRSWRAQLDSVIAVDATCALVLGWSIQHLLSNGAIPDLVDTDRWEYLMWATNPKGECGVPFPMGVRTVSNYDPEYPATPYQDVSEEGMINPALFGIPLGGRTVQLPGTPALKVTVGPDLALVFPDGEPDAGYVGEAPGTQLGDPNVANGVMAYFVGSTAILYSAAGSSVFTSPGTPLCQPVDLGDGLAYAWLVEAGGLHLCTYRGGAVAPAEPLALPDYEADESGTTYTLSRFRGPSKTLFAVLRTRHPGPALWEADVVLCTFGGPMAVTGWTRVRSRTDVDEGGGAS